MKMAPTDDRGQIPAIYGEFVEVFGKAKAETLPPHPSTDHAIDLDPGYIFWYGWNYNLSEFELRMLKPFIEVNLANGFIQWSSSLVVAPILFAKKKDWKFRFCVDYRALNLVMVMNWYSLPVISEMHDCVGEARIFTKLDLCAV